MKVYLMYREHDFGLRQHLRPNEETLAADLELQTLFRAMANDDEFTLKVVGHAVLSGLENDAETIIYRQGILRDCLRNHAVVQRIYDLTVEAIDRKKGRWLGIFSRYPSGILSEAIDLLEMLMGALDELKTLANRHADNFTSDGFRGLFTRIEAELSAEYFALVKGHLRELKFRDGILISARLGQGNETTGYVLRKAPEIQSTFIRRMFSRRPPGYGFRVDPRDEAGHQILSDMESRGINQAANALAQSADHILSFLTVLRTELAFYLGCVNLHRQLKAKGVPLCFPLPAAPDAGIHHCVSLRDACLALTDGKNVVGNDLSADGKMLVIITGANQGGKSTFLRAVGVAQLMMQCGMFVAAESFQSDICRGLFTHYKREEDTTMASGKFDEELDRLSGIVDQLVPNSLLLLNESFAATNELEGSEIAGQIMRAMLESRVRMFFVTHLYEFARSFSAGGDSAILFLLAQRQDDGSRTFKLLPGRPLPTSYGKDLYEQVFGDRSENSVAASEAAESGSQGGCAENTLLGR